MRIGILLVLLIYVNQLKASDPDCEVIEFKTSIEIIGGKLIVHHSNLIQVNNRDGEHFNPLYIFFSKNAHVSDLNIRVETVNGKAIRVIKKKDIEEESAISYSSLYEDNMVKKITLTHNSYPYRIRYEYTRTMDEYLTIARWDPYLRTSLPSRHSILTLTIPADLPIKIFEQEISHEEIQLPGRKRQLTWVFTDLEKFKKEKLCPHPDDLSPYVHIVPESFVLGVWGSQSSWQAFGNWSYRLNEGRNELPLEEKTKIDKLTEGVESDLEKIRILYHRLQDNTRYINVSIDIGGLQTYPASYVCQKGYGDCKALSNYMVAQLEYLGIPAYYTLVFAGKKPPRFKKDFPSQQFNHAIVTVPMEEDTLWLECTDNNAPFGYLSDFTQNRPALLVHKTNSQLIQLPALQTRDVRQSRKIKLNAPTHSGPIAEMSSQLKGNDFEYARYASKDVEENERERYVENFLSIPETDILDWSITDHHRDSSSIKLSASFKAGKYFSKMGNMILFTPPAIKVPDMEEGEDRVWPVKVYTPYHRLDSLDLSIPVTSTIESLPPDTLYTSIHGKYDRKTVSSKGKILMVREVEIPIQEWDLSQYSEFCDFLESIEKFEREKILYKN